MTDVRTRHTVGTVLQQQTRNGWFRLPGRQHRSPYEPMGPSHGGPDVALGLGGLRCAVRRAVRSAAEGAAEDLLEKLSISSHANPQSPPQHAPRQSYSADSNQV